MEARREKPNNFARTRIRAQAAEWVTALKSSSRDLHLETLVRQWVAEDPRHAAAFKLAIREYRTTGDVPRDMVESRLIAYKSERRTRLWGSALLGAALLCGAVVVTAYRMRATRIVTAAGEQKTVTLSDGTQVSVNANSRLLIEYDKHLRKVVLSAGEALFNVAKNQARPYVVEVGDRKVIAVGTSFMVRRENPTDKAFEVTLLEGRVAVEPLSAPDVLPHVETPELKLLQPGERLSIDHDGANTLDMPSIDLITAWRRNQLEFADSSLQEAAAEFNRYGTTVLVIDGPSVGQLRVGGVFRAGDPSSFVKAMVDAYHLRAIRHGNTIVLTDKPDTTK